AGTVRYRLKLGDYVNPGTMIAHIGDREVRSPIPGEVRSLEKNEGAAVQAGGGPAQLGGGQKHTWGGVRGAVLVGSKDDLEDVQRLTRPMSGMPQAVLRQAQETAKAIESRDQNR